ncbi:MAG: zf-HC2 domain-containing protein [Bacteroidales bacterium]|nr:zf-HC2 domain-containing protein [Bacteroidales bacterium]
MDCKTAKRLMHLYKDDELTDREKTLLENHLSNCYSCRTLRKELNEYKKAVKKITDQEPYLSDPVRLTDKIMSGIKPEESGLLQNATRLFRLTGIRIAASVLILVQTGLFSYQQFYISGSVREINQVTQKQNTQAGGPGSDYQECIEESRRMITDILGYDDPGFNRKAIKYSKNLSGAEIENYAVQICRYSDRLQKTGNKQQKKQLLINILSNDLNIKINPGI